MQEFGSDFHFIDSYSSNRAHLTDVYHDALFFADGRMCITALLKQYGWKRLWMPEYFCYEVIASIKETTDVELVFYKDFPTNDARGIVATLPYREGDALLRVNYFGLRDSRSEKDIPVPVIEDHTHDLLGHWSLYSDADWCIASLRKSLPIPEGGMMWSPKGLHYDGGVKSTPENDVIAEQRWKAMKMKADYLAGKNVDKESFRKIYLDTEEWFDHAEISGMDKRTRSYISNLDINAWYNAKQNNWRSLCKLVNTKAQILEPEDESCNVFSFAILAKDKKQRDGWRKAMIEQCIYPAILWNVPDDVHTYAKNMSSRMLSIHCDGRYNAKDIEKLAKLLNQILI